jgi:hypothetical protein
MVQSLTTDVPTDTAPHLPARNPARSPIIEAENPISSSVRPKSPSTTSPRRLQTRMHLPVSPQRSESLERPASPKPTISVRAPSSPTETMSTSRASSPTQKRVSEFSFGGSSLRYSSSSYASSAASSGGWSTPGTPLIGHNSSTSNKTSSLPRLPEVREMGERIPSDNLSLLPSPALGYNSRLSLERSLSQSTLSPNPSTPSDIVKLHRSSTTASQKAAFEKEAFRNSAVLCDV